MNFRPLIAYAGSTAPYLAPGLFLLVLPIPHTVALRLLMLTITLIMAVAAFAKGDKSRPPCLIAWGLWLGAALLSLVTAIDQSYSIGEIKTEIGYGVIAFFAFFVLTRRWRDYVTLTAVLFVGFGILAIAAVYDNLARGGGWQAESLYGGVGDFSTYLVTLLPMLLLLAYHQYRNRAKLTMLFSALAAVLFLLAALMSMNLMFWICFVIQLLALLLLGVRGRGRLKLAIGLTAAGIALSGLFAVGVQKGRITSFTPQGVGAMFVDDPRIRHWSNVSHIIRRQPFHGDGFGRAALGKAHPEVLINNGALWHSHNLFLDATIQMGVQGALALLLLFGCLAWRFNRLRLEPNRELHAIGVAGLVLLIGILSKSMTDNFFYRHLSLLFWAESGMLLGLARGLLLAGNAESGLSRETESSPAAS